MHARANGKESSIRGYYTVGSHNAKNRRIITSVRARGIKQPIIVRSARHYKKYITRRVRGEGRRALRLRRRGRHRGDTIVSELDRCTDNGPGFIWRSEYLRATYITSPALSSVATFLCPSISLW